MRLPESEYSKYSCNENFWYYEENAENNIKKIILLGFLSAKVAKKTK